MDIAYYESATRPSAIALSTDWVQLCRLLERAEPHVCRMAGKECETKISGQAWSPILVPNGTHRDQEAVLAVTAAVFDIDHLPDAAMKALAARLDATPYTYAVYSTHSHTPPEDNCLRVVMPLSRPLVRGDRTFARFEAEVKRFRKAVSAAIGFAWDQKTKDIGRLYYLPVQIDSKPPPQFAVRNGIPLDVDVFLSGPEAAPEPRQERPAAPPLRAVGPDEAPGPVDMDDLRQRLRRVRKPESLALVTTMLRGECLAGEGERDDTINRAASIIAGALPEISTDACLAIMRPSIMAMPETYEGRREQSLEKAAFSFERAKARRQEQLKQQAERNAAVDVLLATPAQPRPPTAGGAATAPAQAEEVSETELRGRLLVSTDAQGNRSLTKCGANAGLILQHAPEWAGALRWNEVTKTIEVRGGPLTGPVFPNTLGVTTADWLACGKYHLTLKTPVVEEQILRVSRVNGYDPLADYLNGLQWDGVPRLDRMFRDVFHAASRLGSGVDVSRYVDAASARWMISCVARALTPGCQNDTVLILESENQGYYKTSALRILGGEWYASTAISLQDKDARLLANAAWIVELAELDSFRRAEASLAKAFFTDTHDTYRPPYGRAMEKWPRRCVWVGTTNETDYLQDRQNRRYWPITVTKPIDIAELKAQRDQLWAEAVARFKAGEKYHFDPGDEEWQQAEQVTAEKRPTDTYSDRIEEWYLRVPPEKRPAELTTYQVAVGAFAISPAQINRSTEIRLGHALRDLGFTQGPRRGNKVRQRMYVAPLHLRDAPQQSTGTAVSVAFNQTMKGGA